MSLRIIYGRAGVGKSSFCIEEIKNKISKNEDSKLILIVPEQFTFETENRMLKEIGESCVLNAEVLSFRRLANRVFNEEGGLTKKTIKDAAKSMLIHKVLDDVISEMKVFGVAAKKEGFIDVISTLVTEFKKYNVDETVLLQMMENLDDKELVSKLTDLEKIFRNFNERLHHAYIDGEDELSLLVQKLSQSKMYEGAEIWIDEFTTFTPQQMDIIVELMKQASRVNITLSMDDGETTCDLVESDVYNVTKRTQRRILRTIEENNIAFEGFHSINVDVPRRFKENEVLAHLEKNIYCYPLKSYQGKVDDIRLYRANNSYDEVDFIAKDILRLVREEGYRYKDISVICRNVEGYEKITSVIFADYEIPYYIDKKIDVASNPLVVLITAAFDILTKNWSYESVFRYLKSGLIGMEREHIDMLENYVLAYGIKGHKWNQEEWKYFSVNSFKKEENLTEENKVYLNTINDIKAWVEEPLRVLEEKCSKKDTLKNYATYLYEFLQDTKVLYYVEEKIKEFEELGMQSKVKEYSQILDILMEVLEQAVDVLGDEKVDKKEFIKILSVGFSKYEMGVVPVALDQVNIGDITRVKSRGARAIYIVGTNDGVLPSASMEEGILSDRDRNMLKGLGMELAADTRTQAFEEQFMVYTALTIAKEYLVITYPLADFEGKAMRPSIITHRIKKLFPRLKEESSGFNLMKARDEFYDISAKSPTFNELIGAIRRDFDYKEAGAHWDEVFKYFNDKEEWNTKLSNVVKGLKYSNIENTISKEMAKKLYSTEDGRLQFSVSKLERYAQCPFAYFIEYGLKAKDRKLYDFSAPDLGSFMHEVLDDFTTNIRRKNIRWSDLSKKECRGMVNDLVNDKINENDSSILSSTNRFKYLTERYKKILTRSVMTIAEQMRRSNFEIFSNEFAFGYGNDPIQIDLPTGETVTLIGRVDRIDTLDLDGETYIRVIDYKTGKKEFDLNKLYNGLQIQLLVYLDVLLKNSEKIIEKQAMPGAMFYFRLNDPMIKSKVELSEEEIEKKILEELRFDGLLLNEAKVVRSMDTEFEEGESSVVIPAKMNKGGALGKNDKLITQKQFDILRDYVNGKVVELCSDMIGGNIALEPYDTDKEYLYENSPYAHIFQFDTTIPGNKYKKLEKDKPKEVWKKIASDIGEELDELK
ncbi:MAG: helicase-exonuclease AddAB subunit AddB [Sarcina sp.]